jgi:hypothetical protein
MAQVICPIHGYYDASEGSCPQCRQEGRPEAPSPLGMSEDDMATDIGGGGAMPGPAYGGGGNGATELGQNYHGDPGYGDETELGQAHNIGETEFEIIDEGPLGLLWVKEGPRRGQIHRIKENSVVGRTRGDILLDDPKVSSNHAKFTFEEENFFIWDFGTRNGTFVNGEQIRSATALEENDEVKIGDYIFVFKTLP